MDVREAPEQRSEHDAAHACLMVHGFTGGPYELAPLAEFLSSRGVHCRLPTLSGHAGSLSRLRDVDYRDWISDMEREADRMARMYGRFDLVGFSMGGLLAAYAANRYPVRRLVLLNAAVIYVSPGRFMRYMLEHVKERDFRMFRRARQTPLKATGQFVRLAGRLREEFGRLHTPSMVVQAELDQVVHPYSADWISKRIQGEHRVLRYPASRHLICWDCEADRLFEDVLLFLKEE